MSRAVHLIALAGAIVHCAGPAPAPAPPVEAASAPVASAAAPRAASSTAASSDAPRPCTHAAVSGDRIQIEKPIAFETDKAVIRNASFPVLDGVAEALRACPDLRVEIQVHGRKPDYPRARRLSLDRARSIRAYLVQHGIEQERLSTEAFETEQPPTAPVRVEIVVKH